MAARRLAPRSKEYDTRHAVWNQQKQLTLQRDKERFRRPIVRFDAYGKPLGKGDVSSSDVAWADVATGLERALNATGDPIFSDALACLQNYGLDKGPPKRSYQKIQASVFGDLELNYLQNIKWLLDHQPNRFRSVRTAAEEVAASYFYNAESFDAAVDRLRKKYAIWKRSGYQKQHVPCDQGNAGYSVRVKPASEATVPVPGANPNQCLAAEGMIVAFTSYWRHRFRDGDVWISKVC